MRGVVARRAGDLTGRVRAPAAEIEVSDRRVVAQPPVQELARHHVEMADRTVRDTGTLLDIPRAHEHPFADCGTEIGNETAHVIDQAFAHLLAALFPGSLRQARRRIEPPDRADVAVLVGQSVVVERRYLKVADRLAARLARAHLGPRPRVVIEAGRNHDVRDRRAVITGDIARDIRHVVHHAVKLEVAGPGLEPLDALGEIARQIIGCEERAVGALGIGVRHDDVRADLFARFEAHAGGLAVLHQYLRNRRVAADFATLLRHRLGHVARDRAHTAFDDVVAVAARGAELEKDFGPGAARRIGVGDILDVEHHGAHALVLEIVGREVDERAGEEPLQDGLVSAGLGAFPDVGERRRIGQHVGLHQSRGPGPKLHPIGKARGIAAVEPRDRCDRALQVVMQERVRAVFVGEEHRRVDQVHRQAAPVQPHVVAHLLLQLPHHVGAGRDAIAIEQLFGGAGTADERPALAEQHLPPRAGEVKGGDQPVVTRADDDRIVRVVCHDNAFLGIREQRGPKQRSRSRRAAAIAAVPSVAERNTRDGTPPIMRA